MTIMMGTRILDAVTDPIIGMLVDSTNTKIGRFRPWILAGSLILNCSFFLIFYGFDFGSQNANFIYITLMYCLFIIGYTFQCTITKSGQTILTDNPKQRTLLNTLASMLTMVLYLVIMSLFFPFMNARGGTGSQQAWLSLALCTMAIQIILSLMSFIGISTKDKPEYYNSANSDKPVDEIDKPSFKDYANIFKNNKALQMLVVAASTNKFAQTAVSSLTPLFYAYVVMDVTMQSRVTPTGLPFTIAGILLCAIYTGKVGRRKSLLNTSMAACTFGVLAIAILSQNVTYIALVLVLGINQALSGATNLNIIPMIADAADYEVYTGGKFIPGMIGTSFSFIDKVVSSIGSGVSGLMLAAVGFVSLEVTVASPQIFWSVLCFMFLIPALGHLFSVIAMKFYPITNEVYDDMVIKKNANKVETNK